MAVVVYENIRSMERHPSTNPRDHAIGAALRDAPALAAMVADEFQVTYRGTRRDEYRRTLGAYLTDLGGTLDDGHGQDLLVRFGTRRITLRFL